MPKDEIPANTNVINEYTQQSGGVLSGGALEAKSVPGEGATFVCDLHLQLAADESTQAGHNRSIEAANDCKDLRVLIVDDNAMVRDAMSALMSALECDFKVADGFSETKKILSSWTPDFIFLDIHMPEADGYQVVRYIRKLEKLSQVAVIALTGDAVVQVRDRALQAGFDDLLAKPISTSKLRLAMQKYRPTTPASQFESVSSR